jgi:hypothetical protein
MHPAAPCRQSGVCYTGPPESTCVTSVNSYSRSPSPTRTSGSTGTEISGRGLIGKRPLHRLIDFVASELKSYQKGCQKQQSWKPAKSRSFL